MKRLDLFLVTKEFQRQLAITMSELEDGVNDDDIADALRTRVDYLVRVLANLPKAS